MLFLPGVRTHGEGVPAEKVKARARMEAKAEKVKEHLKRKEWEKVGREDTRRRGQEKEWGGKAATR